ncbi:Uncharacterized protein SCF082_LOCUS25611 [Durusdinium trenchii]|uniref:Uncharacterized protein n=1 Tax=Durusdinium trenchii TaxID=1381693 RepID=A0ABP0M2L9_9DINO
MVLRSLRAIGFAAFLLSEAAEESAVRWVVGARDADCSTVCATIDFECEEGAWPNTPQEWASVASSAEGLLCLASAPGGWQHNPSICTDDGPAPGVCFWQGGGAAARCSGGMGQFPSTVARRICPCRERKEQEESASAFMSNFNIAAITATTKVGHRCMPGKCRTWNRPPTSSRLRGRGRQRSCALDLLAEALQA